MRTVRAASRVEAVVASQRPVERHLLGMSDARTAVVVVRLLEARVVSPADRLVIFRSALAVALPRVRAALAVTSALVNTEQLGLLNTEAYHSLTVQPPDRGVVGNGEESRRTAVDDVKVQDENEQRHPNSSRRTH